jgi:glycerol-3-phosphate acyltransferase PlsY
MRMKFKDVRNGLNLAVVVNGCLFVASMFSQGADLADSVFSPIWMMALLAICVICCWFHRMNIQDLKAHA